MNCAYDGSPAGDTMLGDVLLTLLSIAGAALIVVSLVLHATQNVALHREARKRAELIRLRLQEEPGAQVVYRKVPIRLSGS